MGDPAGIGGEIILKTLENEEYRKRSIVFGSKEILEYYQGLLGLRRAIKIISDPGEFNANFINMVQVVPFDLREFQVGKVSAVCGTAVYHYIEKAIQWALEKKI